jgi:excinuclease ABC subunit A
VPLKKLAQIVHPYRDAGAPQLAKLNKEHPEKAVVTQRIAEDLHARLTVLL